MTRRFMCIAFVFLLASSFAVAQEKPRVTQSITFAVNRASSLKNPTPTLRLSVGSERQVGRTVSRVQRTRFSDDFRKGSFVTITD